MAITLTAANSHLVGSGGALPNTSNPFTLNVWINATWNGGAGNTMVHTGGVNTATYTYSVGAANNIANSNIRPVQ